MQAKSFQVTSGKLDQGQVNTGACSRPLGGMRWRVTESLELAQGELRLRRIESSENLISNLSGYVWHARGLGFCARNRRSRELTESTDVPTRSSSIDSVTHHE